MIARAASFRPGRGPVYGQPMSIGAWVELDEDVPGELVDGRFEEEEVPDNPHEIVVRWLLVTIGIWAQQRKAVLFGSETKYALTKKRGRKPDLSLFLTRDRKLVRRGANHHPPDVMVEVLSRRPHDHRRDRVQKLREYAKFGVRWFWLLDPEARILEILRLGDDGRYVHELDALEGVIDVPGCEGLSIDLDALWREIDELVEPEEAPSDG